MTLAFWGLDLHYTGCIVIGFGLSKVELKLRLMGIGRSWVLG